MITAPAITAAARDATLAVTWPDVALAFALVAIAFAISLWEQLGLGRRVLTGAVRAVVQLAAVGYLLVALFAASRWYWTILALLVMIVAAALTATNRETRSRRRLLTINMVALSLGAGLTLAYVSAIVITVHPWYDPRYLIPLFGMIVSNAMNGAALAADRLDGEMTARRGEIETYLSLGASPARASRAAVRAALRAAMLPMVNSLAVVGIVSLPGMMTGQILAGASPLLAVRYQIVVMFMLTGAVAGSAAIVTLWYRRTFFTAAEQLVERAPV